MPVVIPAGIAGQPVHERRMREEGEGADMWARVLSKSATRCGKRAVGGGMADMWAYLVREKESARGAAG